MAVVDDTLEFLDGGKPLRERLNTSEMISFYSLKMVHMGQDPFAMSLLSAISIVVITQNFSKLVHQLIAKAEWGKYKNGITESQSLTLFKSDLAPFEKKVRSLVKVPILQNQFDALVILAFNIGESAFSSSSILQLVNNPSSKTPYSSLEKAWMAWNKSRGKVMKGLKNRRKVEWNIYSKNIYQRW